MARTSTVGRKRYDDETTELVGRVTVRQVEDIRGAGVAIAKAAAAHGLRVAAYSDIASREPMVDAEGGIINGEIFGWLGDGERWWEDPQLDFTSFGPQACRYESEPFWCNAAGFNLPWRNGYLEGISLCDFEKQALCAAVIIVPVHMPFGQIGAVAFGSLDPAKDDLSIEFAMHGTRLGAMARRFVAGYVAAMRTRQRMPSDCKLSKREVECLRWAAIGKTDNEISFIVSLSHATVRYHLHRAAEKLDAVNRSQTIFKAGQLGYLGAAS